MKCGPYILVIAPQGYPGKRYRKRYAYEHHVVWWKNTGEVISEKGFLLHHKNRNKHDNAFSNLELISVQKHNTQHAKGRSVTSVKCTWCNKDILRETRLIKPNQKRFFCSRSHLVYYEQNILGVFKKS